MPDQPSPLRILVIEDEAPIRRFLRIVLEGEGHVMDEAARGREGIKRAAMSAPSAIVLDLGLPDMDGKAVIGVIREWSDIPIVVVSVRSSEAEIVTALDAGADDYVTKPFAPAELLARLRALVRRRGAPEPAPVLAIGDLSIDLTARTVTKAESTVHLKGIRRAGAAGAQRRPPSDPSGTAANRLGTRASGRQPLSARRRGPPARKAGR